MQQPVPQFYNPKVNVQTVQTQLALAKAGKESRELREVEALLVGLGFTWKLTDANGNTVGYSKYSLNEESKCFHSS